MAQDSRKRRVIFFLRLFIAIALLGLWLFAYFSSGIGLNGMRALLARTQFSAGLYGKGITSLLVLALILAAFLFGRVYCSALCPLGTLQELCWRTGKILKKLKIKFNHEGAQRNNIDSQKKALKFFRPGYIAAPKLRYVLLLLAGLGAAFAFSPLMMAFDPISTFGRGTGALRAFLLDGKPGVFALLAALPLAAILAAAVFRGRAFCDWCPVGQILGLFALPAPFGMRLGSGCVSCGKCEKKCPVGCINSGEKRVDRSRCVLCLSCVSACPTGALRFGARKKPREEASSLSGEVRQLEQAAGRRRFLKDAGVFSLAAGAAYLLGPSIKLFGAFPKGSAPSAYSGFKPILPPGAKNASHYRGRCVGCQACVASCPVRIIKVQGNQLPPSLDYRLSGCQYNCVECGRVCPTGAIRSLDIEEKHRTRVALSTLEFARCVVNTKRESCGACAEVCPTGAITMTAYVESGVPRLTRPVFDKDYCIGCGACFAACPASPRAITIDAVDEQVLTSGPRPSEESGDELMIEAGDDFPF
jgi:ferredoxin